MKKLFTNICFFFAWIGQDIKYIYNKDYLNITKTAGIPFTGKGLRVIMGWLAKDNRSLFCLEILDKDRYRLVIINIKFLKLRFYVDIIKYNKKAMEKTK